ncbi:MAG: hypothetical protein ACPL4E_08385 [Thermoproteota archaeon]
MSQSFLEKLRDYLNERLKKEERLFKPFEINIPSPFPREKWMVSSEGGTAAVASVAESIDGIISAYSCGIDRAGYDIGKHLINKYRRRLRKAKAKGKEEEEKVWRALDKEEEETREDYLNRRNFEKHLKKSYKNVFIRLLWFDEVAKRISEEYGVEVKVKIADDTDCGSCLISRFNGSSMSEEKKLEEIKKRVETIIAAYKLADGAYKKRYPSELEKEYHEKYLEFRKAILEKYILKSAKKT